MAKGRQRKAERVRELFGYAKDIQFQTKRGFVPLPIVMRRLLPQLTGDELALWTYLQTRADKYGICFPGYEVIGDELRWKKSKISRKLLALEQKGLVLVQRSRRKNHYFLPDPRYAVATLSEAGTLTREDLEEVNDLLENLKLEPVDEAYMKRAKVIRAAQKGERVVKVVPMKKTRTS